MMVTLDTNCIIDLEENRPAAPFIRQLKDLHHGGKIHLRLVGISASEKKQGGGYRESFDEFKAKATAVGLAELEILKPAGVWNVTFWEWCEWADGVADLIKEVHAVLFPNIPDDFEEFCKVRGETADREKLLWRFRNAKCDVLAVVTHIRDDGNIFVSSDTNFHKNKAALQVLGAGEVLSPEQAVGLLTRDEGSS